jgi:threonine/homoserine/homoserine lactone efflux protein
MGLTATLLAWTALATAATMSPGPDTLLVLGHAARSWRDGALAAAGIVAGGLWYMLLSGFGLMSLLTASHLLFEIVKIAGALYLGWLGCGLLRGAIKPQPVVAGQTMTPLRSPFRQGFLTNALNPKVALFYLAVLPQFVGSGPNAPYFGMVLIAIHYLTAAVWFTILVLFVSRAGGVLRETNVWRWLEGALGAAFVGLAGKLALERN